VIHIATHGFFLEERCQSTPVLRENPLLRSGLALAGANRRASDAKHQDGILTAEEVAALDLTGSELVVLSGCDTGAGVAQAGQGVLGLRRAFRIAGAQTLVTSLWPVDDEDTRQWMVALYTARSTPGTKTSQAARTATLQQLRARRAAGKSTHPVYWGGFIAVGGI
jgi:CHAT domain-containing protein